MGRQLSHTATPAPTLPALAGGSAAGSDAIHREVALLRQAGKPVVVSMGNAAASGGYYISCAADKIVAQPGTITGSIGVLAGGWCGTVTSWQEGSGQARRQSKLGPRKSSRCRAWSPNI